MASVQYYWTLPQGNTQVNDTITSGNQWNPAIASNASGRFFAAWDEPGNDPVEGRVFGADGSALGSQFVVNSTTANVQHAPSVAGLSNGNFVVTFTDGSLGTNHIGARVFDQNGAAAGPDFPTSDGTSLPEYQSDVAALADGGFVVTWTRDFGGNDLDVRYRLFNADGSP